MAEQVVIDECVRAEHGAFGEFRPGVHGGHLNWAELRGAAHATAGDHTCARWHAEGNGDALRGLDDTDRKQCHGRWILASHEGAQRAWNTTTDRGTTENHPPHSLMTYQP